MCNFSRNVNVIQKCRKPRRSTLTRLCMCQSQRLPSCVVRVVMTERVVRTPRHVCSAEEVSRNVARVMTHSRLRRPRQHQPHRVGSLMSPPPCLGGASRWWVNTHGTSAPSMNGRPWVAQATENAAKHHRTRARAQRVQNMSPDCNSVNRQGFTRFILLNEKAT